MSDQTEEARTVHLLETILGRAGEGTYAQQQEGVREILDRFDLRPKPRPGDDPHDRRLTMSTPITEGWSAQMDRHIEEISRDPQAYHEKVRAEVRAEEAFMPSLKRFLRRVRLRLS